MAALTVVAGALCALTAATQPTLGGDPPPPVVNKVTLALMITGLGREGCVVEIKPGHPACDFKTVKKKVDQAGRVDFTDLEVKSTSADRDCLIAIQIDEPGQPRRVNKRTIRLSATSAADVVPKQYVRCMLRSPSLVAKDDTARRTK